MKTLQESIIGRRGTPFLKNNLRPGDIVETRGGRLMIVNGNKFYFSGGCCYMFIYDNFLLRIDRDMPLWDIMKVYRPKIRTRSFINLEEKISNEIPVWKRN